MPINWSDRVSVEPTVEPVKIEDARRNCDLDDNYRDADLKLWITEARQQVEHDARVALITQTRVMQMHDFIGVETSQRIGSNKETYVEADYRQNTTGIVDRFEIPAVAPVSSVSSITYLDTDGNSQTLATSVYGVDTNRKPATVYLKYGQSWPDVYDQWDAVTVTYVAGYGSTGDDVPAAARSAILMLVRHRFDMPDLLASGRHVDPIPFGYESMINQLAWGAYP